MANMIEPGRGVGGVRLGMTRDEVVAVCGSPIREYAEKPELVVVLDFGSLQVGLDPRLVHMITVREAEAGATSDGIRVGTPWLELVKTRGEPAYDVDETGSWVDAREPGIWYDIVGPLRPDEETLDPPHHQEHHYVRDPEAAFVRRIYVMRPKSG
jgi:hypothetical protein